MRTPSIYLSLLVLAAACGGDDGASGDDAAPADAPPPDAPFAACDEAALESSIAAVPGVEAAVERACADDLGDADARCFEIVFEQPIDHAAPDGGALDQHLWLIHRGCDRPTVVADWGYAVDTFFDDELSAMFATNALWVEHRYQGASLPRDGAWDWTALTIENGAGDLHRVIQGFKHLYGGRWVSTGASKGGITAVYHRYLHPGDLDGTVPYVAPASRARVDPYYQAHMAAALPQPCGPRLREVQVEALTTRREMVLARIAAEVGEDDAPLQLEYASAYLDWAFWQYGDVSACADVPTADADDDAFWTFFAIETGFTPGSPPGDGFDDRSWDALNYEWLTEQGFAQQIGDHIAPLLVEPDSHPSMEEQFRGSYPEVPLPPYDGSVTAAARAWARDEARDLILIYGEYDPWSGGELDEPLQPSSARFVVPNANHGASIAYLPTGERDDAIARIGAMLGIEPSFARLGDARRAADLRARLTARNVARATRAVRAPRAD